MTAETTDPKTEKPQHIKDADWQAARSAERAEKARERRQMRDTMIATETSTVMRNGKPVEVVDSYKNGIAWALFEKSSAVVGSSPKKMRARQLAAGYSRLRREMHRRDARLRLGRYTAPSRRPS
jgi:hypothetical protein